MASRGPLKQGNVIIDHMLHMLQGQMIVTQPKPLSLIWKQWNR